MKISLGMSGGVDSSASAVILKNLGYDVSGVTLKLFGESDKDAKSVCESIGISHTVLDLKELFYNTVIDNFLSEYISGRTPNPCIVCNEKIKFGAMLDFALENGSEMIATGHYAVTEKQNEHILLKKPADKSKDQTYVLYGLTKHQLSHTVFPLGNLTKAEVREIALQNGFVNAEKKDSQDICFVPDGDYAAVIKKLTGTDFPAGDFLNINGLKLGDHKGLIHYTIGQRKGLGIALGKPAFVIDKNAAANSVTIGDEKYLFKKNVRVKNTNFIGFDGLQSDMKCKAKLRYRHTEQPCILHPVSESELIIEFDSPQRAPAIGQSAVFYDGEYCLGGGIIEEGF